MAKESQHNEWVSLRQAADLLGVHPATVRNWADRGDLPMRRTPGGHRRFRRSDLEQWIETRQSPPPAEVQMLIQSALGRMRMHISEGEMARLDWYSTLSPDARHQMRSKGLRMMESLQRYLAEPRDAQGQAASIQDMGRDYARFLIGEGLALTQAVQGFQMFSDMLHEAALNILEVVNVRPSSEWLLMLRQVRRYNNEILLGITQVYEEKDK